MRYERKYKLEGYKLSQVIQALKIHPASLVKIYPDRQINNIYFDTPELKTYKENVAGIAMRKKFRVRWYGNNPAEIQNPLLELKIRHNELGTKEFFPVSDFKLDDLNPLTQQVNKHSFHQGLLLPVLMNSYGRAYYGTRDQKFRLTIDYDLRFFSMLGARQFTKYVVTDPALILELKYDEKDDDNSDRITQHLPFRQTKNSKYVVGVTLTV